MGNNRRKAGTAILQGLLVLMMVVTWCPPALSQDNYYMNRAKGYMREAEYYTRKAEDHDREATYYNNKAQGYLREADYYSQHQNADKARTYIRWDKARLRTTWANDAREKAQLRMKWAREAMEKAKK